MNAAYDATAWSNFFVAEAGAAAALTGLVIVAVSINLASLVGDRTLSGRAAETVVLLAGVLILSSFVLVPGQPSWILGTELMGVGLVVGIGNTLIRRRTGRNPEEPRWLREIFVYGASGSFAVAGLSLIQGAGGGLYWLVPGVVLAFVGGVLSAWVLLVEILR